MHLFTLVTLTQKELYKTNLDKTLKITLQLIIFMFTVTCNKQKTKKDYPVFFFFQEATISLVAGHARLNFE